MRNVLQITTNRLYYGVYMYMCTPAVQRIFFSEWRGVPGTPWFCPLGKLHETNLVLFEFEIILFEKERAMIFGLNRTFIELLNL